MIATRTVLLPVVEDGIVKAEIPIQLSEQCATCKHWTQNVQCLAFPELIPEAIRTGKHDHREPFEGDQGIRYEPI